MFFLLLYIFTATFAVTLCTSVSQKPGNDIGWDALQRSYADGLLACIFAAVMRSGPSSPTLPIRHRTLFGLQSLAVRGRPNPLVHHYT
jgi:hypothetical protein